MSLYVCNGCMEEIPAHKARVHCDECIGDYNSCANCYVVGIWTGDHDTGHENHLNVESGHRPKPPPMPPRPKVISPRPAAAQQAASPTVQQSRQSPLEGQGLLRNGQTAAEQPAASSTAQQATTSGWAAFFSGSTPTQLYSQFLGAIFTKLDTDKDGLITPGQYTSFLDVQQYTLAEHVWKRFHIDLPGYTADDAADFELRTSYENFGIRHEMRPRPNAKTANMNSFYNSLPVDQSFKRLLINNQETRSFTNGMMPMLTLQGFIDITTIETLYEPNPGWLRMNRVAKHYRVWVEQWGEIPRSCMPEVPPQDLVRRVALVTQQSTARAQSRINNAAAESALRLQGQEAAIRLLDPPGTRYYYY